MELAKQQHRQELYINVGVWLVVLLFLSLAALQVSNLSSGCVFPDLPYEYIWNAWSSMVPNTCTGPHFASLSQDRLVTVNCPTRTNASLSVALYPPKEVRYSMPVEAVGDFTVANCHVDGSLATNVLVHLNRSAAAHARASAILSSLAPASPAAAPPSVLVIVLSALSDAHFERTLPLTLAMLRDAPGLAARDAEAFHFRRYNAVSASQLKNTLSLLHGSPLPSSTSSPQWLWHHYQRHGYVTLYGEEDCRYMHSVRKYFSNAEMIDHRFTELFCQLEMRRRVGSPVEDTSAGPVCLGSDYQHAILMKFLKQFESAYAGVSRFGVALFNEAAENSMVRIKSMDEQLRRFIASVANNTVVVLTSEMGAFDTSYALRSRAGKLEAARPFLYVLTPRSLLQVRPGLREALRANELRLITGADIYATLRHVPALAQKASPNSAAGESLFTQLSDSRSCSSLSVERGMCACENRLPLYLFLLFLPFSIIFWWLYTWSCKGKERRQQSRNLLV